MTNKDIEILFCEMVAELIRGSEVIKCEEGAGRFISVGAVNSMESSFIRALNNDEYLEFLLNTIHADGKV